MDSSQVTHEQSTTTAPSNAETSTPTDITMAAVMAAPLTPLTTANLQIHTSNSPPTSNASSPKSATRRNRSANLSLDLTTVPPLSSPAPPTNTLLITRLDDPKIFHPASLATIRQHLNSIAPLNSFSPLKSMSRLIVSFYDEAAAVKVRQEIDRTAFSPTSIAKCYFGEPTPIGDDIRYLEKPDAGRLFFISPPPSPPVGWESKAEDPPNKEVHAEDLASQLSKLSGRITADAETSSPTEDRQYTAEELARVKSMSSNTQKRAMSLVTDHIDSGSPVRTRSRSSTLIYDPKAHGESPGLPAVMLETEDDSDVELDSHSPRGPMAHTARPPVELMDRS